MIASMSIPTGRHARSKLVGKEAVGDIVKVSWFVVNHCNVEIVHLLL